LKSCVKALIGLVLVFVYHIPRLIFLGLLVSYAYVFNRHENLTANPREHLKRACKLLKGQNSQLLYAALEIRFAVERMTFHELALAEKVSNKALKDNDPVKRLAALHRLDEDSKYPHAIYLVDRDSGKRYDWGQYKPLDKQRIKTIEGRLGDLLHAKQGLSLGISDDPWYTQTRQFLKETLDYLEGVIKDNTPFFAFKGLDRIEMVRDAS
jgi:hypothetical protein